MATVNAYSEPKILLEWLRQVFLFELDIRLCPHLVQTGGASLTVARGSPGH